MENILILLLVNIALNVYVIVTFKTRKRVMVIVFDKNLDNIGLQEFYNNLFNSNRTIGIATLIFIIQAWMNRRINNLTNKIYGMTEEYKNRLKKRIENFKDNAIHDLQEVKNRYNDLYQVISKHQKSKTLSKDY
jgi:gas vesicle protein